jgi:hypothetical protein
MIALAAVRGCGVQLLRWGQEASGWVARDVLPLSLFEVAGGRLVLKQ